MMKVAKGCFWFALEVAALYVGWYLGALIYSFLV